MMSALPSKHRLRCRVGRRTNRRRRRVDDRTQAVVDGSRLRLEHGRDRVRRKGRNRRARRVRRRSRRAVQRAWDNQCATVEQRHGLGRVRRPLLTGVDSCHCSWRTDGHRRRAAALRDRRQQEQRIAGRRPGGRRRRRVGEGLREVVPLARRRVLDRWRRAVDTDVAPVLTLRVRLLARQTAWGVVDRGEADRKVTRLVVADEAVEQVARAVAWEHEWVQSGDRGRPAAAVGRDRRAQRGRDRGRGSQEAVRGHAGAAGVIIEPLGRLFGTGGRAAAADVNVGIRRSCRWGNRHASSDRGAAPYRAGDRGASREDAELHALRADRTTRGALYAGPGIDLTRVDAVEDRARQRRHVGDQFRTDRLALHGLEGMVQAERNGWRERYDDRLRRGQCNRGGGADAEQRRFHVGEAERWDDLSRGRRRTAGVQRVGVDAGAGLGRRGAEGSRIRQLGDGWELQATDGVRAAREGHALDALDAVQRTRVVFLDDRDVRCRRQSGGRGVRRAGDRGELRRHARRIDVDGAGRAERRVRGGVDEVIGQYWVDGRGARRVQGVTSSNGADVNGRGNARGADGKRGHNGRLESEIHGFP